MAIQLGVPAKLLKDCEKQKVTVEVRNGDIFSGLLEESEENMSVSLSSVKAVLVDGKTLQMECIYIKGSRVKLIKLPASAADNLKNLSKPARPVFRGGRRGGFRGGRGGPPRLTGGNTSHLSSLDRRRY